jgi:hypothetical protein
MIHRFVLALLLMLPAVSHGKGDCPLQVLIRASIGFAAPQFDGTAVIRWRNDGTDPARTLRLLLFGNRFREPPPWNGLSRYHLLAGARYDAGRTEVLSVLADGKELASRMEAAPRGPGGLVLAVDLGRALEPGEEARVQIRFQTTLPNLFDVYGATPGLVVADGGWYPLPLSLDSADSPQTLRPHDTRTQAVLTPRQDGTLLLNGRLVEPMIEADAEEDGTLSLVFSRKPLETVRLRMGERIVSLYSVPADEIRQRTSHNAGPVAALLDALPTILERSPARGDLTLVRLPLRWYASQPTAGMILLSDRLFEIVPLLRPLHERELAYGVYLQEELAATRARESPADSLWVAEGLAWQRADEVYRQRFRGGREVRDWIRLFDLFAIVDRFETAPRIPFVRTFFPVLPAEDPLEIRLESLIERRPPGRMILSKLEARLRPPILESLIARYRMAREPFRSMLRDVGGAPAEEFLDAWLAPYPEVNYALEDVKRNPGGAPGASFAIARESTDPRPDTVEIALEERDDREGMERLFIDVDQARTEVQHHAGSTVRAVTLDPDRRLIEARLDDNRRPSRFHLLLDSADVEVSSTEFGVSTLVVGRRRYDYRKDLAAAGFLTNRGYGVNAGFQLHGGAPIDRNLFQRNLFAYYSAQELDRSFRNDQEPEIRTSGRLAGFGFRFNDYDTFWFENPSGSRHLRIFFDAYDRALGGDFDYVQGGASLAITEGVREDTVLAGQVLNGFSTTTAGGVIPNQGLFSLGGFRSIRGIGAEEELGRDIFILRAEIRHLLPYRLDFDFEDLLIARRLQLKAFVDAGRIRDDTGGLYDPSHYAVGVGAGLNLFYEFFGFFPTSAYLDVATRADRPARAQFLFGVRQPF